MSYNTRIYVQQGACELTVASGASLNIAAGGVISASGNFAFSGGYSLGQASATVVSGGLQTFQAGASLNINHGASDTSLWRLNASPNTISVFFNAGRDIPTYSASPGAIYFRSDGSVSGPYFNISSGTTGSVWRAAASG